MVFSYKQIRPVQKYLFVLKKRRRKKAFDLVDHKILLSKLSVYLYSLNSLPFSVHTLKIEYNVSLSVVPTLLKELFQKGQSWDLYSSAAILMTYLYIYHQTL